MHNESPVLSTLEARLYAVLSTITLPVEIICVDDGSHDDTWAGLLAWQQRDSRLQLVRLSRNFGHEAAILAGLKQAKGDAVITLDADLQDPPELIPALIEKWQAGFDVVYAVRDDRSVDTWLKRVTSGCFYKTLNRLSTLEVPGNTAEYRLMSRRIIEALLSMPEQSSFVRMMTRWVGFAQTTIAYKREPRAAGVTKYNVWKLWNYALDAITGFSHLPLRIWSYVGIVISLCAFLYALVIIAMYFFVGRETPGYASLMVAVLFLGGIQLICLGIMGEYLGRVFMQVKGRPLYIISDIREGGATREDTHGS
jgi:glycosyltransferase involved in cell wall biosynthesis